MKSKVVKTMGRYYFKKLGSAEWAYFKEHLFVTRLDNMHSEEDIKDFMEHHNTDCLPFDLPLHRFFFIPDYSETESVMLTKSHHAMADGSSQMISICAFSDNYHKSMLLEQAPILNWWKRILMLITLPYYLLKALFFALTMKKQCNPLNSGR